MIAFAIAWDGRASGSEEMLRRLNGRRSRVETAAGSRAWVGGSALGRASDIVWLASDGLLACFDGWLDDLPALRADVGCDVSASPATALAHGYQRYGENLPRRLRGDYAFVIWDRGGKTVFAARDPFGIRPLHYARDKEHFYVASGADQIVRAGLVPAVPDDRMIVEFLVRRVVVRDRSFFRDVWQVPSGHQLSTRGREIRIVEHRRPPEKRLEFADTRECLEAVKDQLEIAVRRSLSTGERTVIELSGGLDSTSITCLADRLEADGGTFAGQTIAVAGLHPGLPCDESDYIQEVAKATRIPVITWDATHVDPRDLAEPLFAAPGSSVAMSGGGTGMLSSAREHRATIVLNGTGGDQVGEPLGVLADKLRLGRWREAWLDLSRSDLSVRQLGRSLMGAAHELSPVRLRRWRRKVRSPRTPPWWLTPSAEALFRESAAEEDAEDDLRHSTSFLSAAQRLRWRNLTSGLLGLSLDTRQRFAGAHALEARFPFLDWDLVSLLLAVPTQHWPASGANTRIHREALATVLPSSIYLRRTKAEFSSAAVTRVRAQIGFIADLFGGTTWKSARYVSQVTARRLFASFQETPHPDLPVSYGLWAVAALEAWLRKVLGYTP